MAHFRRETERFNTAIALLDAPSRTRDKLIQEYKERSKKAFAPTTRRNLFQMIAMFEGWCKANAFSAVPPVSPSTVAAYVEYLGGKLRPNTIELRLWAISELHNAHFTASPCKHRLVTLALKGVKRTYGTAVNQAPPLTKKEVLKAINGLGSRRIEVRDKAVLWIASDSWCRASEIVALRVRDLSVQEDGSSLLFIRRSKTDQYGQGAYAYLSKQGTRAVLDWVDLAQLNLDDPILVKSQKGAKVGPMDSATISRIIKRCTGRRDVSAHSTRIGGVHDAFKLGCDLSSIMIAGRWSSPEMPARYGRRVLASQSAAAKVCEALVTDENDGSDDGGRADE